MPPGPVFRTQGSVGRTESRRGGEDLVKGWATEDPDDASSRPERVRGPSARWGRNAKGSALPAPWVKSLADREWVVRRSAAAANRGRRIGPPSASPPSPDLSRLLGEPH